ncbi:MAG: Sulfate adenylyltransferase [Gammaproteobacteria bacterium]|nr:Sulfate adenylyltransferase [Gammaproteobacteria bacterium]
MIRPHGSEKLNPLFVSAEPERSDLVREAEQLPSLLLNSGAAANAVMLGAGYFNPLAGYMNKANAMAVCDTMRTTDGLFWPVPILNLVPDVSGIATDSRIALRDPNVEGQPVLATMHVDAIETLEAREAEHIAQRVYGTRDPAHPGVKTFLESGRFIVSGPLRVVNFSYFKTEFPETFRTAVEIRDEIGDRGWNTVVAFQTRNPMHRAHEELCKMAMEEVGADGCVVHMLLGKLKSGDIPASVRDAAIRKMAELYFPVNSVMITGYGFDMLYAGPREAVLHAIFRQNMGATHLIVGRDHAGVGAYYGPFDAQEIFTREVPSDALEIEIYSADHTAYSKKLNRVVMMRDAPDHSVEDFVLLSGTRVRELLGSGIAPPEEFSRPEVARILMDYYQSLPKN